MKVLVYSDLHLSAKKPRYRLDNYSDAMLNKLEQVYDLANREADCVLFLGDFFDTHVLYSYRLINQAMEIVCDSDIETYAILGQHDLRGYNEETYETSTLGFMETHCCRFHTLREPLEFDECVFHPCHCYDDIEAMVQADLSGTKEQVLLAHHLITKKRAPFHTYTIEQLTPSDFGVVFFGDYHPGMSETEREGTIFWSPGALARKEVTDDREILVGLCEISESGTCIDERALDVAPFSEVFDVEMAESVKKLKNVHVGVGDSFVERLQALGNESIDFMELVRQIGKERETDQTVLEYIFSKKEETHE